MHKNAVSPLSAPPWSDYPPCEELSITARRAAALRSQGRLGSAAWPGTEPGIRRCRVWLVLSRGPVVFPGGGGGHDRRPARRRPGVRSRGLAGGCSDGGDPAIGPRLRALLPAGGLD